MSGQHQQDSGIEKTKKRGGPNKAFSEWATLILVIVSIVGAVGGGGFKIVEWVTKEDELKENLSVEELEFGSLITGEFGSFELSKGNTRTLQDDADSEHTLTVGDLYSRHNYLYVWLDGVRLQMYDKQKNQTVLMVGNSRTCKLTLANLIIEREAGVFNFRCD